MRLTYRLSDQAPYLRTARSGKSLSFDARGMQVEASLGQDMRNILLDLRRDGPFRLLRVWRQRWHYRKELARLLIVGPYMISDVGLTLDLALAEAGRPFWRRSVGEESCLG
ncbi:MAG TPA: hypothetical protein VMT54_13165 [Candidatus Cybelea sp.]|nr:hypothetical protein [Candidatus Cybelea sp.]